MDGTNNVAGQYNALQTELKYVDEQMNTSVGIAQIELAAKKMRILDDIVQLCEKSRLPELARQWGIARRLHVRRFPSCVVECSVTGSVANSLGSSHNEGKKERRAKGRLANVPPETPDQVNDKKVSEKCCQLDRVYVQLETMTTPRGEKRKNFPRQHSFVVTVSECYPNSGGGNRTKAEAAEDKRRNGTLVVMRSVGSSMLEDGTLGSAILALAEKLKVWNDGRRGGDYDILQRQDRVDVKGLPFDVAVALDWTTYFRHVFTEELSFAGDKRRKKSGGDCGKGNATKKEDMMPVLRSHAQPLFPLGRAVQAPPQAAHPLIPSFVSRPYEGMLADEISLTRNRQAVLRTEQQEDTTQGLLGTREQMTSVGAQWQASLGGPSMPGQWIGRM